MTRKSTFSTEKPPKPAREKKDTVKAVVLIPTTGFRPLTELIKRVKSDSQSSLLSLTIVVALNGRLEYNLPKEITVLKVSDVPIGVANTVNYALGQLNPADLVWTIADDDEWISGKFHHDLGSIKDVEEDFILLPRAELIDEFSRSIRPLVPIRNSDPIFDYLFSQFSFRRNPRYVTLSGACAKRSTWTKVAFEHSPAMEDIIYLHKQQLVGTKLLQANDVTVRLNVSVSRSASRNSENRFLPIRFAETYLDKRQSSRYFNNSILKPFALLGKSKELISFANLMAFGQSKKLPPSTLAQMWLLTIMWTPISIVVRALFRLKQYWRCFSGNRVD
jgi:hypothetical protein